MDGSRLHLHWGKPGVFLYTSSKFTQNITQKCLPFSSLWLHQLFFLPPLRPPLPQQGGSPLTFVNKKLHNFSPKSKSFTSILTDKRTVLIHAFWNHTQNKENKLSKFVYIRKMHPSIIQHLNINNSSISIKKQNKISKIQQLHRRNSNDNKIPVKRKMSKIFNDLKEKRVHKFSSMPAKHHNFRKKSH